MYWLLTSHLVATLFMTGLIWFVQIVHYPLFAAVGEAGFAAYEARHRDLTTWVVAPAMLVEAFSAAWLTRWLATSDQAWLVWSGMALVLVIWLTTACYSVPAHEVLSRGFDPIAHQRLVSTNWIRTAAWSIRAAIAMQLFQPVRV
jgi:uncharacterized membrane protein